MQPLSGPGRYMPLGDAPKISPDAMSLNKPAWEITLQDGRIIRKYNGWGEISYTVTSPGGNQKKVAGRHNVSGVTYVSVFENIPSDYNYYRCTVKQSNSGYVSNDTPIGARKKVNMTIPRCAYEDEEYVILNKSQKTIMSEVLNFIAHAAKKAGDNGKEDFSVLSATATILSA